MKYIIRLLAFSSAALACLWLGLTENSDGLLNIGLALTWVMIIGSAFTLSDDWIKKLSHQRFMHGIVVLLSSSSLAMAGLLVYFGWFITGGLCFLGMAFAMSAHEEAARLKSKREKA